MPTTDVNLLPKDMMSDKKVETFADKIKNLALFLLTVVLLGALGSGIFYYVLMTKVTKAKNENAQLSREIKAMEQTEQQLVLFKDRLGKVQIIKELPSAIEEVTSLQDVYKNLPEGSSIDSSKLTVDKSEITILVASSKQIAQLFSHIAGNRNYVKTELQQFSYDRERGYLVTINLYTL